jgi:DNA-binding transcriptional regulator PaaX
MKERQAAEDWLLILHYGLELILCPSPARILESFEAFEYRHRLRRQFRRLEESGLLERASRKGGSTLRLTREGTRRAHGDVVLTERWNRPWDGRWRMLLFDLPARDHALRVRLW